jgi:2-isopropylmalate synthase
MTTQTETQSNKDRVYIFDTTLRDGEQSPGATMTLEEKLQVAEALDEMGVDIIEAGFPIASNGDFEAVVAVAKHVKNAVVAGLARAIPADIARAGEAVRHASGPHPHLRVHLADPSGAPDEEDRGAGAGDHHRHGHAGAQPHRQCRVERHGRDPHADRLSGALRELAIKAGATTINLPDTVGYAIPDEHEAMFRSIIERVPGADKVIFSAHCHNDLGLAVANSLAAVRGGARQVECTINGLGERAGNAALEEVVMALRTRGDAMPFDTEIDATHLSRASKIVSAAANFPVQYNKAIVGKNAFAHESGIHQDGMLKNAETYEIMTPESVGIKETTLVMGKHSGPRRVQGQAARTGLRAGRQRLPGSLPALQGSRRPQEARLRRRSSSRWSMTRRARSATASSWSIWRSSPRPAACIAAT